MEGQRSIFVIGSFVVACSVDVPRLPVAGETLRASRFHLEAGGKGFNCLVALRRLGVEVDGLLMTGDDMFVDLARSALDREGLPASILLTAPGRTGVGVGLIQPDGENLIAVYPGANDQLAANHIGAAGARIGRAAMTIGQFEVGDAPLLAAFGLARAVGATTVLNPSPFRRVDPALLDVSDVLVVNESEAEALAITLEVQTRAAGAERHAALARTLHDKGVMMVVITAGANGASAWLRDGTFLHQPALKIVALDTIGSGDAFLAGLCAALNRGADPAAALRDAAACGAFVASRHGVLEALPRPTDIQALHISA